MKIFTILNLLNVSVFSYPSSELLSRSKRIDFPNGFEEKCIQEPCDEMTFFQIFPIGEGLDSGLDPIMLHMQYNVCVKFIQDLRDGCPSVTASIAKYPELVDVVYAVARLPGVRSSLQGKYTIKNFAEPTLRRTCMQTQFNFN